MLTHNDRTIPDAVDRVPDTLRAGVRHIGFKDVGLPFAGLRRLADRIRAAGATLEACRAAVGSGEIPRNSPFAVTVPGAIDAWEQLLRDHGTRSLAEMLQPAIRFARDG